MNSSVTFRTAVRSDWDAIFDFFRHVLEIGGTYFYPPDIERDVLGDVWFGGGSARRLPRVFVALSEAGEAVGSFVVKPNFPALGDHVANASFIVAPEMQGRGIGRAMGERALEVAREEGYTAMQFNRVIASNEAAVRLWQKLGFAVIGCSPGAYRHPTLGPVDALIMHRTL